MSKRFYGDIRNGVDLLIRKLYDKSQYIRFLKQYVHFTNEELTFRFKKFKKYEKAKRKEFYQRIKLDEERVKKERNMELKKKQEEQKKKEEQERKKEEEKKLKEEENRKIEEEKLRKQKEEENKKIEEENLRKQEEEKKLKEEKNVKKEEEDVSEEVKKNRDMIKRLREEDEKKGDFDIELLKSFINDKYYSCILKDRLISIQSFVDLKYEYNQLSMTTRSHVKISILLILFNFLVNQNDVYKMHRGVNIKLEEVKNMIKDFKNLMKKQDKKPSFEKDELKSALTDYYIRSLTLDQENKNCKQMNDKRNISEEIKLLKRKLYELKFRLRKLYTNLPSSNQNGIKILEEKFKNKEISEEEFNSQIVVYESKGVSIDLYNEILESRIELKEVNKNLSIMSNLNGQNNNFDFK